ncbi:ATP-binding protein [Enhygromyxa salina]|uniref:Chaperone protein HtpG n=1 Tax=Enhygromyxa salina TaxID=215803 RepID=A0A2S9YLW3_9BACT|nr:ATP-binding protein [Enhygromyxa salina]PRQ06087.1 Chaperone protein HtpG [Enhygromyxa salina]
MRDDPVDVGEALETLVHQFSDPWSFLRELIQNALDAGSPEIDVRVDHEPPDANSDDPLGLMTVEVIDAGDGMDRQIIDTRLTRLFSSAKDGDYTKIGRFGIGFVSVFAIAPDLVCVDTGRAGEYWRVLFRKDRSFQRIVLEHPTEGTTIRIYKRATADQADDARARARAVLEYWCKHARVEIRCDDELVSRPMQLDARCVIQHEQDGTHLLLGYVPEAAALRGYYHGGLTLHEEHDDLLPHVAFKIDSRYLEHTLTRDNVIRDDNFAKAMNIVGRLASTKLVEALVSELELAASEGREDAEIEFLRERLLAVIEADAKTPSRVFEATLVPALSAGGGRAALSLTQARRQIKRCWTTTQASPVTERLIARGDVVLLVAELSALARVLAHVGGRSPTPVASVCTALPATSVERISWQPLHDAALALLAQQGVKLASIELGRLAYPGSPVADHVAITQTELGELTPVSEIGQLSSGWFGSKRIVVLNADHPTVGHLIELAATEPELAAYLLLKLFYLRLNESTQDTTSLPTRDNQLASAAAQARAQRRS